MNGIVFANLMISEPFSPFTDACEASVCSLSETRLIESIQQWLGPVCPVSPGGIGDDCAVTDLTGEHRYLLTTVDGVAWGEHFDHTVSPELAGRKLIARNLSDIASMGGIPRRAVVSLWMCAEVSLAWLEAFYRGIAALAQVHGVSIVGGDISRAPAGVFIADLCLQGMCERPVQRKGVGIGDTLWVTGELGGSILGHHARFEPRIAEGRWLSETGWAKAMMDVSDGLAKDLASLVGNFRVEVETLPISEAAIQLADQRGGSAREHALCDGEDYELVFALDRDSDCEAFSVAWAERFATPLTCMGSVVEQVGNFMLCVKDETGAWQPFGKQGYEHF